MAKTLDSWEKDGLLDDAIVIIMSDHGHHWYKFIFLIYNDLKIFTYFF